MYVIVRSKANPITNNRIKSTGRLLGLSMPAGLVLLTSSAGTLGCGALPTGESLCGSLPRAGEGAASGGGGGRSLPGLQSRRMDRQSETALGKELRLPRDFPSSVPCGDSFPPRGKPLAKTGGAVRRAEPFGKPARLWETFCRCPRKKTQRSLVMTEKPIGFTSNSLPFRRQMRGCGARLMKMSATSFSPMRR